MRAGPREPQVPDQVTNPMDGLCCACLGVKDSRRRGRAAGAHGISLHMQPCKTSNQLKDLKDMAVALREGPPAVVEIWGAAGRKIRPGVLTRSKDKALFCYRPTLLEDRPEAA